ncbi:hypothetical protein P4110_11175 [Pseudomonas aeruginosa]|nr:hypothetical protein [Pseudomonas aeruginosa]
MPNGTGKPVGRLRLGTCRRRCLALAAGAVLRRFTEAYPDLQLELSVEDRMVDIVADGHDAGTPLRRHGAR